MVTQAVTGRGRRMTIYYRFGRNSIFGKVKLGVEGAFFCYQGG